MNVNISRVHYPVSTLGPGDRIGVWFQGCSLHCDGCISIDTWEKNSGQTTVAELISSLEQFFSKASGITISGGEPFEQFASLQAFLVEVRKRFFGDILVYSGYSFDFLVPMLSELDGLIDAVITEPFMINQNQTLPLRGSDNQILHRLTPTGEHLYRTADDPANANFKSLDIMFDQNSTVWIAGIPSRGDLTKVVHLLGKEGFTANSTEHNGVRQ